jgi:hypothetical protein
MSLQTRLDALITAVGGDIKSHNTRLAALEAGGGGGGTIEYPWMLLMEGQTNLSAAAAGTYAFHKSVTEDLLMNAASPANAANVFTYFDPADYAIAGKAMKMRLVVSVLNNNVVTAVGVTLNTSLVNLIPAGATTTYTNSIGSSVLGSIVSQAGLTANQRSRVKTAAFDPPVAGAYTFSVVLSAAIAGFARLGARLEYTYV